jgi:hypothetical protein
MRGKRTNRTRARLISSQEALDGHIQGLSRRLRWLALRRSVLRLGECDRLGGL